LRLCLLCEGVSWSVGWCCGGFARWRYIRMRRIRWRRVGLMQHLEYCNRAEDGKRESSMRSSRSYTLNTGLHASSLKSYRNVTMSVLRLSKFFEMLVKGFEKAKIVRWHVIDTSARMIGKEDSKVSTLIPKLVQLTLLLRKVQSNLCIY